MAPELGLFVVADGMGGYHGGEVASRLAVGSVDDVFREEHDDEMDPADEPDGADEADAKREPDESWSDLDHVWVRMDEAFRKANAEVRRKRTGQLAKMGSTLSAMILCGEKVIIGHVGDSRVYRFRGEGLRQLTSDHSLVAAMRAAGISNVIISAKFGHVITRAIGVSEATDPDIISEKVESGDKFLLCTDGLTDVVDDETISRFLERLPSSEACTALVEEALRRGGQDNITALIVEVRDDADEQHADAA